MRTARLIVAVALTIIAHWGCANRDRGRSAVGPSQPAGPAHAIHDAELRALMHGLERGRTTVWPQEIEDRYRREYVGRSARELGEMEKLAVTLAQTAQRIPDVVSDIDMSEADRRSFASQAETLHDQAMRLATYAKNREVERVRITMLAIERTCQACHSRFRDFAGSMPYGR